METKEKNKKLLIIVGVLLLFGGISLAYFVNKILTNGDGGKANVTTAVIKGATINVEGVISFEDLEILPGHKSVSGIKLTATGNNELIPYNLIWKGTNTLTTPLNYTIYKTSEEINVTSTCEVKKKAVGSVTQLSEECNISNIDRLGSEIAKGTINKNESKVILAKDEFITATSTGDIKYYYVILEYPNLEEAQNYDLEGSLEGEVTVEESNIKPDINIIAAYIEQDNGEYTEVEDIPQEGYALNSSKSICSNNAVPVWTSEGLLTANLTKSGTNCYLYFDKAISASTIVTDIIARAKAGTPDFSQIATGAETEENNGIYGIADEMYRGTSYYWRGATTTNHVIFANSCWRIVRINGDSSIRLIYDGTVKLGNTCAGNGANSEAVIMGSSDADRYYATSDGQYNKSYYVGWTYVEGKQRPEEGDTEIYSNAKTKTEEWYNSNIGNNITYASKVADGKFCNDRNIGAAPSGWGGYVTTWSVSGTQFAYAAAKRIYETYQPTLACDTGDVYTLKVGAITADEVMMAGGKNENNTSYYMYTGQNYWTMSPDHWTGASARVFYVGSNGYLDYANVGNNSVGLRPVINLKSDTLFATDGQGTQSNPYIVL